jgi:hypothetical protein
MRYSRVQSPPAGPRYHRLGPMDVPGELASRFKFARQKSKLAGVIRGSFFVIKGEY